MDWNDVDDILFDGTEEQIRALQCPDCGGALFLAYYPETRNREIKCDGCGTLIRAHGAPYTPNFALYNIVATKEPAKAG